MFLTEERILLFSLQYARRPIHIVGTPKAFGVPTIWMGLLAYCRENNKILSSVKNTIIGGSALSLSTLQEFDEVHDVNVIHAWGMTEMSSFLSYPMHE